MSLKNIGAVALCSLLTVTSAWASELEPKEQQPVTQAVGNKMPQDAKLRLAQRVQAKQQQVKPKQVEQQSAVPVKEQSPTVQTTPAKPKSYLTIRKVNLDGTPYVETAQPAQDDKKQKKHKKNKKKQNTEPAKLYEERAFYMETMLPRDYQSISIFGEAQATKAQALAYLRNNNPNVKLACSPEKLIDLYWEEAQREGIYPDIAFCQAILETGFFKYGGDVVHKQNNFCGLGTTGGGVRGASFKTPQLGVRAHVQHLLAYSKTAKPKTPLVDPRYKVAHDLRLSRGLVDKWYGLNGTWAMGSEYCEKIMYHYARMLATKPMSAGNVQPAVNKNNIGLSLRERLAQKKSLRK